LEEEGKSNKKRRKIDDDDDERTCCTCKETPDSLDIIKHEGQTLRFCRYNQHKCFDEWKSINNPICQRCKKNPGDDSCCGKNSGKSCTGLEFNHPRILCEECDTELHMCRVCKKSAAENVCLCDTCDYLLGRAMMKEPIFKHTIIDFMYKTIVLNGEEKKRYHK
jgi:hypothetical protein